MSRIPRLDVLLYAHDGRGLGHVSRSVAVGLALRRCCPELKVLLVSGSRMTGELVGDGPLDWLKLPAYETEVCDGKSRGVEGRSGFTDTALGELRAIQIRDIFRLYRPRLVLSDHTPQGKHRELLPALAAAKGEDTRWLLGVRGVVGNVKQVKSELARSVFRGHYHEVFWYGDSGVLGQGPRGQLAVLYGVEPVECGYVSRLTEMRAAGVMETDRRADYCGTLSVPWLGEGTEAFLEVLADALALIPPDHGVWRLFVSGAEQRSTMELFCKLPHCQLEPPSGKRYADALLRSRSVLVFGGYNSLMDVLGLGLPATVVLRQMDDGEQQEHLENLEKCAGNALQVVSETEIDAEQLAGYLLEALQRNGSRGARVNLRGAEYTAHRIGEMLK